MAKGDTFMGIIMLLLIALAFMLCVMIAGSSPSTGNWELGDLGQVSYMQAGGDDTLYAFSGNSIYAIDSHGSLRWNFTTPAQWSLCLNKGHIRASAIENGYSEGISDHAQDTPIFSTFGSNIYLLATTEQNASLPSDKIWDINNIVNNLSVVSISHTGRVSWSLPVSGGLSIESWAAIDARQEGVYLFHEYNETLIDHRGNVVWNIENVSDPAAVDEQGFVYTVSAVGSDLLTHFDPDNSSRRDYRVPSSVVQAYYPNGTLYWSRDIGELVTRQQIYDNLDEQYMALPLYENGMLIVPVHNGVIAMDRQGNEIWSKHFSEGDFLLLEKMPFDSYGDVYMRYYTPGSFQDLSYVYVISADGSRVSAQMPFDISSPAARDGIIYYVNGISAAPMNIPITDLQSGSYQLPHRNLTDLDTVAIMARDYLQDRDIWRFVVPVNRASEGLVTGNNTGQIVDWQSEFYRANMNPVEKAGITSWNLSKAVQFQVLPGKDITYVVFSSLNYESPIVVNQSKFVYSSGIYALDKDGKLIWSKPLDSFVTSASVNGSIIYYTTGDGKITSAGGVDVVAGLAATAVIYVIIRFFLVGAVSRARSRLDSNENRGRILKFIVACPGSNVPEIARALRINIGTVRYHLFILSMNHRVVSISADEKYLRYFTNSGTYSVESQRVISLMKRDGINKVLTLLNESPGLSNRELSQRSGIQESAMSRYLKELSERGIVQKEKSAGGVTSFFIEEEYRKHIASVRERLYSQ